MRLLVRAVLWLLTHTFYRLRRYGLENVPATGPALLVSNHVTYLDWLFIVAAQPRHVHFVIFAGWTRQPLLGWLLNKAGVIPIDHRGGGRAIIKSLRAAGEYLKQGKLVCIFAEGRFTRTGFLLPFKRGFEQIVKYAPAPIVPVFLDQAWGSILSYYDGKLIWKRPRRLPYTVGVAFGEPLPAETSVFEVRQALQLLSAKALAARKNELPTPIQQFLKNVRRRPFKPCLLATREGERTLSYLSTFIEAHRSARRLREAHGDGSIAVNDAENPRAAAITNIALAMCRQPAVNARLSPPPPEFNQIPRASLPGAMTFGERVRALLALFRSPRGCGDELATIIFHDDAQAPDKPLGVKLTWANIAANCESLRTTIGPEASDRLLGVLPLADSFGYTITLWLPLVAGASVAFVRRESPEQLIGDAAAACRRLRCTVAPIPASLLKPMLENWTPADAASLRTLVCAGGPLDSALAERCQKEWGIVPLEGYGRHELGPAAIVSVPDRALDGFTQHGSKPGAVGHPLPGVAVRIVDRQTKAPLPPGEAGRLWAFGANVSPGYWRRPDLDAQRFADGWFDTGDEAMIDEDGFVSITRRAKDASPRGSEEG
jgi:acyl-[acyl-carrier-protein]-phospholipid O-acyltransferase/long-chain-fatty-acid--[acyl-carrier-protein] ligase